MRSIKSQTKAPKLRLIAAKRHTQTDVFWQSYRTRRTGIQQRKDGDIRSSFFTLHSLIEFAEDSLFVFKSRRLNSVVAPVAGNVEQQEELDVHSAFPIFGEFHLTMSQMRRQTVDSSVSLKLGRVSAMNASCSGAFPQMNAESLPKKKNLSVITLSIHPAEGLLGHGSNLTFGTTDVDGLKRLVAECKRLKDVTGSSPTLRLRHFLAHNCRSDTPPKSITNFSWLRYYFAKRTTVAARKHSENFQFNCNLQLRSCSDIHPTRSSAAYPKNP